MTESFITGTYTYNQIVKEFDFEFDSEPSVNIYWKDINGDIKQSIIDPIVSTTGFIIPKFSNNVTKETDIYKSFDYIVVGFMDTKTVVINTTPSDATVEYTIKKTNGENYTFTINPTPSDAIVTLTADGYTQDGNSITVANGTSVNYSVSKDGYTTQSASVIINEDTTENIVLELSSYTASITFNIIETSGIPLVYCSVGDYSCGTRGEVSNPVSIASELNGKTINCNTGDNLLVATQSEGLSCCVGITINDEWGDHPEYPYVEQDWYTVVEGPQTLTIETHKVNAPL